MSPVTVGLGAVLLLVWVPGPLMLKASFITYKVTVDLPRTESSEDPVPVPVPSTAVL